MAKVAAEEPPEKEDNGQPAPPRRRRGSWTPEGSLLYSADDLEQGEDVKSGWYQLVTRTLTAIGLVPLAAFWVLAPLCDVECVYNLKEDPYAKAWGFRLGLGLRG